MKFRIRLPWSTSPKPAAHAPLAPRHAATQPRRNPASTMSLIALWEASSTCPPSDQPKQGGQVALAPKMRGRHERHGR